MKYSTITASIAIVLAFSYTVAGQSDVVNAKSVAKSKPLKDIGSFPYHPLIYHLDLSLLSYKLSRQTMIWPFDPYYEEMDSDGETRSRAMRKIKAWAALKSREQLRKGARLEAYRGPGILSGFNDNASHDPIIYRYDLIHPWSNSLINLAPYAWAEDRTPNEITGRIKDVYVCNRKAGKLVGAVTINKIAAKPDRRVPKSGDILLAFEGGTGDKGERGQPASQSLMGFVLLRRKAGKRYDVHVVFRGSQSGSTDRSIYEAMSGKNATGNPDWITDMGYDRIAADRGGAAISSIGAVHRGFAQSMKSILPNVFHCLNKVANLKKGINPDNIYVTGHSLGGGLAQHFVGAVLLGNQYRPGAVGGKLSANLKTWPWKKIKLITFSAPRTGDKIWARTLTETGLQSEFFSTLLNPYDMRALQVPDPNIVPRLLDTNRPVGYRVLNSTDPVSTEKGAGGKHVGKTIYVDRASLLNAFAPPDLEAHRLDLMRLTMLKSLNDRRTPRTVLRYLKANQINRVRSSAKKGSTANLRQLAATVSKYYKENNIWFDHKIFNRNVSLRLKIERGK